MYEMILYGILLPASIFAWGSLAVLGISFIASFMKGYKEKK